MKISNLIRRLIVFSIAIGIFSVSFSQNVNYWHLDGRVYFKLKDNVPNNYASADWGRMKLEDIGFLDPFVDKYQLVKVKKPFFTARDQKLERTYLLEFSEIYKIEDLILDLNELDFIEYAEPAPLFRPSFVPNDTYFDANLSSFIGSANSSWHLNVINAEAAWDITTGDANINVAVLDNAIYTAHPDLVNKISVEIDLGDDDSIASPPEFTYIWSHGTHSAGLVGAETNNGIGVASIGYNVSIMAVKLGLDASDGQAMAAGFEGIVWAADNGADVISMSWGSPQYFQTMQNTVNYAYNKGCTMLAAAGNNGNGMESQANPDIPVNYIGYPAALQHVIAVGSSDVGDNKSDFSNYGTWIDVLSPGGYDNPGFLGLGAFSVLSTTASDAGDFNSVLSGTGGGAASYTVSGKYDVMQGTSMACPVAAGLAGLMKSLNPNLTPDELKDIMKATCTNVDAQNAAFVDSIGAGRINAAAACQAVIDSMDVITADFQASAIAIIPGDSVDFTDLSTGNPVSWNWVFEGGNPSTSTSPNPTAIHYDQEGFFTVTLEVSDGSNTDIEVKTYFILVGGFTSAQSAWERQNSGFNTQYRGILDMSIADDQTVWGISYDGTSGSITNEFTRTTDGGATWTPGIISGGAGMSPGNITAINGSTAWISMYVTTGGGGIYRTGDAGATWTHQATADFSGTTSFVNVIHFFDINNGFCMGDPNNNEFEIYTTSDGGDNWTLVDAADIPNPQTDEMGWTSVFDAVGDIIWFGTNKGRVYKSLDRGFSWNVFNSGEANISDISMNDELNGVMLAAIQDQTTGALTGWSMRSTTNGGETWQLVSNDMNNSKSGVDAVPGVPGMVVGYKSSQITEENASFYSMDFGNSWTQMDDSVQYTSVKFINDSTGWAGSFNLSASFDGVYKWIGVPASNTPYFTSTPTTTTVEDSTYTYHAIAEDPNAEPLTLEATTLPAWMSFIDNGNNTGTLSGIPVFADLGTHSVQLIVYNSTDTAFQSFVVTVVTNDNPPEFTSVPGTQTYQGTIYTYNVTAIDQDTSDVLTLAVVTAPSWLTFSDNGNGNGLLTGIPTSPSPVQPGHHIVLSVFDGELTTEQSFYIFVPYSSPVHPPVFTSQSDTILLFSEIYTYIVSVSDTDGDTVVIDAVDLPSWLNLTDNGVNSALLTGTPPVSDTAFSISLTANDGQFPLVYQNFNLHIDQAPRFTSEPDTIAIIDQVWNYNVTTEDADNDPLVITAYQLPAWLSFTDNGNNTAFISGTPSLQDSLDNFVSLNVSDGLISSTQNFHISIQTSIRELENERLLVYPNPAFSNISVEYNSLSAEKVTISIFDVLGKKIYESNEKMLAGSNIKTIDISALTSGAYMFEIQSAKRVCNKTIVKK